MDVLSVLYRFLNQEERCLEISTCALAPNQYVLVTFLFISNTWWWWWLTEGLQTHWEIYRLAKDPQVHWGLTDSLRAHIVTEGPQTHWGPKTHRRFTYRRSNTQWGPTGWLGSVGNDEHGCKIFNDHRYNSENNKKVERQSEGPIFVFFRVPRSPRNWHLCGPGGNGPPPQFLQHWFWSCQSGRGKSRNALACRAGALALHRLGRSWGGRGSCRPVQPETDDAAVATWSGLSVLLGDMCSYQASKPHHTESLVLTRAGGGGGASTPPLRFFRE